MVGQLLEAEVGKCVCGAVLQTTVLDRRASTAIDYHRDTRDLRTRFEQRINGGQYRATSGGCVLNCEDASTGNVRTFDATLQSMGLLSLAYHERIEQLSLARSRMHHRGGNRIGTERETTDGLVLPVRRDFAHDIAYQRGRYRIECDPAKVHVIVRFPAAGQDDLSVDDGLVDDLLLECIPRGACRHGATLGPYRERVVDIEGGLRVLVLPDPSWVDREATVAAIGRHGLGVLDVDAPMESKAVCASLIGADISPPLVVVAHGDACLLLPAVALSLRTQHRDTAGYVVIDPDAPPATDVWPESPVVIVSTTEQDGTSLRGWPIVSGRDDIARVVTREVLRIANG